MSNDKIVHFIQLCDLKQTATHVVSNTFLPTRVKSAALGVDFILGTTSFGNKYLK